VTQPDVIARMAALQAEIDECERERKACLERAATLLDRVYEAERERKMLQAVTGKLHGMV